MLNAKLTTITVHYSFQNADITGCLSKIVVSAPEAFVYSIK